MPQAALIMCLHSPLPSWGTKTFFAAVRSCDPASSGARAIIAAGGYRDQTSANEPQRGSHTHVTGSENVGLCIRHPELSHFVVFFDASDAKSPTTRAQVSNTDTSKI